MRAAKAYLSNNDPIVDIYRDLASAIAASNATLIQTYGFNALARLAYGRNHALGHLAADGAAAAFGTGNCMQYPAAQIPAEFTLANLTSAFDVTTAGGIVEVRGGDPNDPLVTPADPLDAVTSPLGARLWGAETTGGATWSETFGGRSFIFGYIVNTPATFETLRTGATVFELAALPKRTANTLASGKSLLVANCVAPINVSRIQHNTNIVTLVNDAVFCGPGATTNGVGSTEHVASAPATGIFASAQRVLNWLAPRPLYAASMMFLTPSTGGKIGSLSPSGAVDVDYPNIGLTFDRIGNFKQNVAGNITVHASTVLGNKPENVLIKLFQEGNQGWFELPNAEQRTDVNGNVTFTVTFPKTGSFHVRADGFFNGDDQLATSTVLSNQFNVKP